MRFLMVLEGPETDLSRQAKAAIEALDKTNDVTVATTEQVGTNIDRYRPDRIVLLGTGSQGKLFDFAFQMLPRHTSVARFLWTYQQPKISALRCQFCTPANVVSKIKDLYGEREFA
jgi:hypothetical protein